MNKSQGGAIAGGIAAAIIIGVILTTFASEDLISSDSPQISEDVTLDQSGPGGDSVGISDSHTLEEGVEYHIDEEGNKQYVIEASDSPDFGE